MRNDASRGPGRGASTLAVLLIALVLPAPAALAQSVEVTVLVGRAFPTFDDRLVLRAPSIPAVPNVEITASGTPELRGSGGPVLAGAFAFQPGFLGFEARLDVADMDLDVSGARFDLRATGPPFEGLTGSVTLGNGRFDVDRLKLVSLNLRLRTPGPVGLVASGGLSYLPDITVSGSVALSVQVAGADVGVEPRLRVVATPGEASHQWGVNGGIGIRVGGAVSFVAEARVFYFRSYELRFGLQNSAPVVDEFLGGLDVVRFNPVIVNAQAGLAFRF